MSNMQTKQQESWWRADEVTNLGVKASVTYTATDRTHAERLAKGAGFQQPILTAVAPPPTELDPRAKFDYEQTWGYVKLLTDIRFRLLAAVPTVTAVAVAFYSGKDRLEAGAGVALGLLGLIATLGIIVYELRNSELYERGVWRLGQLERSLEMTRYTLGDGPEFPGGLVNERNLYDHPDKRPKILWFVKTKT